MKRVIGLDGAFFTQSLRGKPLIVYNHYSYCKHSIRNGISRWTCSTHSYKCCKAVVKTKGSHIIEVKGHHNHDASDLLINRGKPMYYSSLSEIILDKTCDGHGKISVFYSVPLCPVCGDFSSGLHYGIHTCESCKSFFKRSIVMKKSQDYQCVKSDVGTCIVNVKRRTICRYCRYLKCIEAGITGGLIPQYSWSRLGNAIIILGEHRFKKRSNRLNQKQEVHWVCNKTDKGCKAKLTTLNDAIVKMYNVHDHDSYTRKLKS